VSVTHRVYFRERDHGDKAVRTETSVKHNDIHLDVPDWLRNVDRDPCTYQHSSACNGVLTTCMHTCA
jgi:hypothetical protein